MTSALTADAAFPHAADSPEIVVRRPIGSDSPGVAALFAEMQRHYRRPVTEAVADAAARLACKSAEAMFDPHVLIALKDQTVVGSIVLNVTFPAFALTLSLYIRDLYVSAPMRHCGVGQALVRAAAQLTYAEGYSALDWTTETGNLAARQMYEACGARVLARTYYRLAREDLPSRL